MRRTGLLRKVGVTMAVLSGVVSASSEEVRRHALTYKGNEAVWQFVNKPWDTNDAGDMIVPGCRNVGMHLAFNTERVYSDCVFGGKFQMS